MKTTQALKPMACWFWVVPPILVPVQIHCQRGLDFLKGSTGYVFQSRLTGVEEACACWAADLQAGPLDRFVTPRSSGRSCHQLQVTPARGGPAGQPPAPPQTR